MHAFRLAFGWNHERNGLVYISTISRQMYNPSALITSLHDLPRYGYPNTLNYVDDTWEEWNNYITGMSINPGIVIVFGLLALLTLVIVYGSVCCCRCCGCCRRLKGGDDCLIARKPHVIFGAILVIMVTFSAAACALTVQFSQKVSDVVPIARTVTNYFGTIGTIESTIELAKKGMTELMAYPPYHTNQPLSDSHIDLLTLHACLSGFILNTSTILSDIHTASHANDVYGFGLLPVFLFWPVLWLSILYIAVFIPRPCCAVTFKVLIVLGILFTWVSWMVAGGMFAASIAGSDVCHNVDVATTALFRCDTCTSNNNLNLGTSVQVLGDCDVCYYVLCDDNSSFPESGLVSNMKLAVPLSDKSVSDFNQAPQPYTNITEYWYNVAQAHLLHVNSMVHDLDNDVSCFHLGPIVQSVENIVCGDNLQYAAAVFILLTVQLLMLTLFQFMLVPLWTQHPALPSRDSLRFETLLRASSHQIDEDGVYLGFPDHHPSNPSTLRQSLLTEFPSLNST